MVQSSISDPPRPDGPDDDAASLVDSLNVSVAGGILLYALLAQRQRWG